MHPPPVVTGPSGTARSSPPSPGPGPGPRQWPPTLGRQHRLPFGKYAEAPPTRPARLPAPLAPPRPRPPRPGGFQPALPRPRGPRPAPPRPAREPRNFPPRAAAGGRAHLRAEGRLPRARQRRPPRRLGGPQRPGSGGLTVHAWWPAARRPGRCSAT